MGFLRKLTGGVDKDLLRNGLPGRGVIAAIQPSGTTVQMGGGLVERACVFQVQVYLDEQPPYLAKCKQRVAEIYLGQFQPGSTAVAVRVNPEDPQDIVIDFDSAPPTVRMGRTAGATSAAEILATGRPAQAVIVENQGLGVQNAEGVDMMAFTLTVIPEGAQPYQIQVGNPTPPEALPLLYPGSKVPVKLGAGPNDVVIDWKAALAASAAPTPPPAQQWGPPPDAMPAPPPLPDA